MLACFGRVRLSTLPSDARRLLCCSARFSTFRRFFGKRIIVHIAATCLLRLHTFKYAPFGRAAPVAALYAILRPQKFFWGKRINAHIGTTCLLASVMYRADKNHIKPRFFGNKSIYAALNSHRCTLVQLRSFALHKSSRSAISFS